MSLSAIWSYVRSEPVMILALLLAILSATAGLDWRQAVIVAGGLICRQFTKPNLGGT